MFKDLINKFYVIAEVGQNHQGDINLARKYVKIFAEAGAHAIKFQTRNNSYLFDKKAYNNVYNSENAFAQTYGAHREHLELTKDELKLLKDDCNELDVHFMSTPFDEPSLDLLIDIDVDVLKVASFDVGNIPFLSKFASTLKPTVMSTGGANMEQISASVNVFEDAKCELALLHCVSEYPCPADRLNLSKIRVLDNEFKYAVIGSSDHYNGILSGPIAYMQGARVFEKHVTLDRSMKGTDHSFALEKEGFRKFVRDLGRTQEMLEPTSEVYLGDEPVFKKLGKSIVAATDISSGSLLTLQNLSGKVCLQHGIPVRESNRILGKKTTRDIPKGAKIEETDLC